LILDDNKIGNEGAKLIANLLQTNTVNVILFNICIIYRRFSNAQTLTTIHLDRNDIENEGIQYFVDALINNKVQFIHTFNVEFASSNIDM
jgi:hypothetical protein